MAKNVMKDWDRLEFDNIPIYIRPDAPDWFVPNEPADQALMKAAGSAEDPPDIQHLLKRLKTEPEIHYKSRTDLLKLEQLKECWIHITNRCNMTCRHCMFQSSPENRDELTLQQCRRIIDEALALGCRLFYFTGGEPLVSKSFSDAVESILASPDTHVVVLTNLMLVSKYQDWFTTLPKERLHIQVSLDGLQKIHDAVRGPAAFLKLDRNLDILKHLGFPITLSTTVTRNNVEEMEGIVDFAAGKQIKNLHFLWLFKKGNADEELFVAPEEIFTQLQAAQRRAEKTGVKIDNIESFRSQVFSCPGTRYDLSNAGWQSLAVGPDGHIYPTPALIYTPEMKCGHIDESIEQVWRRSPVLGKIRSASLNDSRSYRQNALRYLIGGGDIDHSFIHTGRITGGDPYVALYSNIAQWLIVREARRYASNGRPAFRLKMGEKLGDCPAEGGAVFYTHSNCVLSLPGFDTHTQVNRFYSEAAEEVKEDILNPVCYEESLVAHIPEEMRYRSYGCGSPVLEADVQPGRTVVDLGSGTGIECFMAAKLTGPTGKVVGIDMGKNMLNVASAARKEVAANLGYDNIEFKQAFLEELPLPDRSVDIVISNCVVNLSPDKRRVFTEVFRILKPGGRLVISDISYDEEIPLEIKYNETLRGECIGGALRYHDLFGLLNDIGFSRSRIEKGYPYRTIKDHIFYSITYQAVKPGEDQATEAYGFPDFKELMAQVESEPTCACFTAPAPPPSEPQMEKLRAGCMVCGEELTYFDTNRQESCHYCGQIFSANAQCQKGHFVCDACHSSDAIEVIRQICLNSRQPDALALLETIRSHPQLPMHGPEHHAMVPAVILTAMRNGGENISDEQIESGIERGRTIAGGACAFFGVCGAAMGAGIAFSVLIAAKPTDGATRRSVQTVTQQVIGDIAAHEAPRCCQRDSWLAVKAAAKLFEEKLGKTFKAEHAMVCRQFAQNKECIHARCPLWPKKKPSGVRQG